MIKNFNQDKNILFSLYSLKKKSIELRDFFFYFYCKLEFRGNRCTEITAGGILFFVFCFLKPSLELNHFFFIRVRTLYVL